MPAIRTFIAIAMPGDVREAAASVIRELRPRAAGVRWVSPENLHLTLRFLGDVEEPRIQDVFEAVNSALQGAGPFTIRTGALGAFPSLQRPRVFYVSVEGQVQALRAIQDRIEGELVGRGFPAEDRPFSPHLTIGRVPQGRLVQAVDPRYTAGAGPDVVVQEILVMKSELRPTGPIYTSLRAAPLVRPDGH